jgi:adenine-specific DNA glycosylase
MIPPRSPFSLIQEDLWPSEWKILCVAIMLNCTSRKQVEKVWPEFVKRFPTPQSLHYSDEGTISEVIASLGFKNRRAKLLMKMTEHYLAANWDHAKELPGIGEYGARSWEIFVKGELGDSEPKDHALTVYYRWCKAQIAQGTMTSW